MKSRTDLVNDIVDSIRLARFQGYKIWAYEGEISGLIMSDADGKNEIVLMENLVDDEEVEENE